MNFAIGSGPSKGVVDVDCNRFNSSGLLQVEEDTTVNNTVLWHFCLLQLYAHLIEKLARRGLLRRSESARD